MDMDASQYCGRCKEIVINMVRTFKDNGKDEMDKENIGMDIRPKIKKKKTSGKLDRRSGAGKVATTRYLRHMY